MFDISSIRGNGKKLVEESLSKNPNFEKEREFLKTIDKHVLSLIIKLERIKTQDVYPLKSFCEGLNRCLLSLRGLKGVLFEEVVKAANNVTALSLTLTKNPVEARKKFGELGDMKGNLITLLSVLSEELKKASERLEKVAVAA